MGDLEFDVLDGLYFVTSFSDLKEDTGLSEEQLQETLKVLWKKKWVRCMQTMDEEVSAEHIDWKEEFKNYYYLASKEGLMAHNGMR